MYLTSAGRCPLARYTIGHVRRMGHLIGCTLQCTMLSGRGQFKMSEFYVYLYIKNITKNIFFFDESYRNLERFLNYEAKTTKVHSFWFQLVFLIYTLLYR